MPQRRAHHQQSLQCMINGTAPEKREHVSSDPMVTLVNIMGLWMNGVNLSRQDGPCRMDKARVDNGNLQSWSDIMERQHFSRSTCLDQGDVWNPSIIPQQASTEA